MKFLPIVFILSINFFYTQTFEYTKELNVNFSIYDETNNIKNKIISEEEFNLSTPENVAQAFFFASSNKFLEKIYFNSEIVTTRDDAHYETLRNTKSEDIRLILLDKVTYNINDSEMCYIMFIVKIKNIDFVFPTLLSLIKQDDKWLIYNLPNQQDIRDCLFWFKPCVMMSLINGINTNDDNLNKLISETKTNNFLDFYKLNQQLIKWDSKNENSIKFTMAKDAICPYNSSTKNVKNKIIFNGIYKDVKILSFENNKQKNYFDILKQVDNGKDSIVLTEMLEIGDVNPIQSIKYYKISNNGDKKIAIKRINNKKNIDDYILDFLYLFEHLNHKIFEDLSPKINDENSKTKIYEETRGKYNLLNITKLKKLFDSNISLFKKYLEE
ncbi:hypothetical protein [Chryseobacterium sp.]|uniref:hypothetical protein n=1 Tax=Chryseobacterium sp. TaxID=1871047 RepID=UPI002FC9E465